MWRVLPRRRGNSRRPRADVLEDLLPSVPFAPHPSRTRRGGPERVWTLVPTGPERYRNCGTVMGNERPWGRKLRCPFVDLIDACCANPRSLPSSSSRGSSSASNRLGSVPTSQIAHEFCSRHASLLAPDVQSSRRSAWYSGGAVASGMGWAVSLLVFFPGPASSARLSSAVMPSISSAMLNARALIAFALSADPRLRRKGRSDGPPPPSVSAPATTSASRSNRGITTAGVKRCRVEPAPQGGDAVFMRGSRRGGEVWILASNLRFLMVLLLPYSTKGIRGGYQGDLSERGSARTLSPSSDRGTFDCSRNRGLSTSASMQTGCCSDPRSRTCPMVVAW